MHYVTTKFTSTTAIPAFLIEFAIN